MGGEVSFLTSTFAELVADGVIAVGDGYRAQNEELGDTGPVFLRSAYLQDSGWALGTPDRLANPFTSSFGPKVAREGDTVVTTKGNSLGRLGYVRGEVSGAVYSPHLSFWRSLKPQLISPRYLYYWASSPGARAQVKAMSESTDMAPYLSLKDQLSVSVSIPSIAVQNAVAELLGALDDKIELNRQLAETLEATSRALFRSWFVDFDPVRAKAEGRSTGPLDSLTALFPNRFVDDGLPQGWLRVRFSEQLSITKGNSYKSADLAPSQTALVTLKSFYRGGGYRRDGLKPFTGSYKPAQVVVPGELVIAGTDVTQAAEIVGQPAITEADPDFTTLVASLDTFIARPKQLAPWFWALALREQGFVPFARGYTTGTTVLHLSSRVFDDYTFVLPKDVALLQKAEELLAPLIDRRRLLAIESRTLADLRDTLLPKLISGELRIRDAEQVVAAAA